MHLVLGWISQYGYAALFTLLVFGIVGLPVPDETLLVFCGYLISKGKLQPAFTFFAGLAGSACGISISYYLGRTMGHGFLTRYGKYVHFTEERLAALKGWFGRLGHWVLTVGYYIPGFRHFTAITAGISGLPYPKFALFAYAGAAIWVASFLTLGYFVGDKWESAFASVHRAVLSLTLGGGAVVAIVWWWQRRDARHEDKL